jgi:hypothetical protein
MQWRRVPLDGFRRAYRVSSLGHVQSRRVKGGPRGRLGEWQDKEWTWNKGYLKVRMTDDDGVERTFFVHILVLTAFRGARPEGHRAVFRDGDRGNVRLANLAWAPRSRPAPRP